MSDIFFDFAGVQKCVFFMNFLSKGRFSKKKAMVVASSRPSQVFKKRVLIILKILLICEKIPVKFEKKVPKSSPDKEMLLYEGC